MGIAIFFMITVIAMLWKISNDIQEYVDDNLNEILIASAEYIGENIKALDKRTQDIQSLMQREIIPKLDNINIDTSGITITNSPQVNEILTNIDTNVKKAAAYIGKNIKSLDENILDKIEEIKQEVNNKLNDARRFGEHNQH